ncbi:hypothetical protein HY745_02535 [Candidatus Desantisbacteria bacterium]|nr:hypothetical protein [Candidatus Desantisbacteria bacterium]
MKLSEYIATIEKIIREYSQTDLILTHELYSDLRTEKLGILKGIIVFIDNSKLMFTEYVNLKYGTEKVSYSYHYQDAKDQLIFRYDNSKHRPPLLYLCHKHFKKSIIESKIPNFSNIIEEIIAIILKKLEDIN